MNDKRIIYASGSTGSGTYDDVDQNGNLIESEVVNFQLENWKNAKKKYHQIVENGNKLDIIQVKEIILDLGQGLTDLFGMNYSGELNPENSDYTPPMRQFINRVFPDNGWDLKAENLTLYDDFTKFDEIHKDAGKHMSPLKISQLEAVDIITLKKHMKTVQEIWLWFLKKRNPDVSESYLIHFRESFD